MRLDHLGDGTKADDGVFVVKAPAPVEGESEKEKGEAGTVSEPGDGAGENQEEGGRWLAKGFMTDWLEFKLEELEISKNA